MDSTTRTYKVLSLLLTYPDEGLISHINTLQTAITDEAMLSGKHLRSLETLMRWMSSEELIAVQEHYVELFDRGNSLSLHMFEHVHGDSRARGEAMVTLSSLYLAHGLQPDGTELPDYIPLFLEFLATQPVGEARKLLSEPIDILKALAERLKKRQSLYHAVFDALVSMASAMAPMAAARRLLTKDKPGALIGPELDKQWAEEPVTFMGGQCPSSCPSGCGPDHHDERR